MPDEGYVEMKEYTDIELYGGHSSVETNLSKQLKPEDSQKSKKQSSKPSKMSQFAPSV